MAPIARPAPATFDELLTVKDVAELYCLSIREVYRKVRCGALPQPIKLGPRTTRWKASEIQAHLDRLMPAS
jgi:predicted DNA-binding transcriptional regulator AlpA